MRGKGKEEQGEGKTRGERECGKEMKARRGKKGSKKEEDTFIHHLFN